MARLVPWVRLALCHGTRTRIPGPEEGRGQEGREPEGREPEGIRFRSLAGAVPCSWNYRGCPYYSHYIDSSHLEN